MILDFWPDTKFFTLQVRRHEADPREIMKSHGLDFSTAKSTPDEAWLMTREPYAAVAFFDHATDLAHAELISLQGQINRSWATSSARHIDVPADKELSPFQVAGVDYVLSMGNTLIGDEMGLGKCAALSEPVYTPVGWRTMGDLSVGDMVYSVDGTPTRVVGVYPQGVKESYRMTFRDGTWARCGDEHLWSVSSPLRRKRARLKGLAEYIVKTTRELIDGGLTLPSDAAKWYVPLCRPVQHPYADLPIPPYALGILLGDGSLAGDMFAFTVSDRDRDILDRMQALMPEGATLTERRGSHCSQFGMARSPWRAAAQAIGIRVLSREKHIPAAYMLGSAGQRLELLRGLMDSDGSCRNNRTTFHTISPQLADDVAMLVRSLGGIAIARWYDRIAENKPAEAQVNVKINLLPFHTAYKAKEWRPQKLCGKYIRSIEYDGEEEQVCIRVEHPSCLYLTRDFTVTHNTIQAIAVANEMQAQRVLVICPANIRLQWCNKIREWTTMRYPFTVYPVMHGRRGVHPTAEWTVVSYDLARTEVIWRVLAKGKYDLLVLDEAHALKTIDAKRTRTVFGRHDNLAMPAQALGERASRILALTGTPLPNRPREAYTLARGLCWDAIDWMSEDRFTERFNPSEQRETPDGKTFIDERSGRHFELQARLRSNFMVRRLKRDVLPQLKIPFLDIIHVEETGAVRQALNAEKLLDIDPENMEGLDMTVRGQVSTVRRMMGIAIAPLAADYIEMLLDGGEERICVFAWHVEVLDILMRKLAKYNPLRIDGSTSPTRKPAIVAEFAKPGSRLLIGNILSMGTGTDGLQEACQRGVAAEASWVAGDNEQAVARLDRMGQTRQVLFDFIVAPGSYSEHVLGSSLRKRKVTHTALDQRLDDW